MSYYKEIPSEKDRKSAQTLEAWQALHASPGIIQSELALMLAIFQFLFSEALETCSFHGLSTNYIRVYCYWVGDHIHKTARYFMFYDHSTQTLHTGHTKGKLSLPWDPFGQSYLLLENKPADNMTVYKVPARVAYLETHKDHIGKWIAPCARRIADKGVFDSKPHNPLPLYADMQYNRLLRCVGCCTLRSYENVVTLPPSAGVSAGKNCCTACLQKFGLFRCADCLELLPPPWMKKKAGDVPRCRKCFANLPENYQPFWYSDVESEL